MSERRANRFRLKMVTETVSGRSIEGSRSRKVNCTFGSALKICRRSNVYRVHFRVSVAGKPQTTEGYEIECLCLADLGRVGGEYSEIAGWVRVRV